MKNNAKNPEKPQHDAKLPVGSSNLVKEIRVAEILNKMMDSDMELYEKILDTPGFGYHFNELVKLAQK
jgi:hypothetical protein